MSERLFLLLSPLILQASLLLSEFRRDNLQRTKRRLTKKKQNNNNKKKNNAQSLPGLFCLGLNENGRALAIILPSFSRDNYKTQRSPLKGAERF